METQSVTIIVLTYKRPEGLAGIVPMIFDEIRGLADAEVLVVDNDVQPTAQEAVAEFSGGPIRYVHEPVPGISAARNRGLAETEDRDVIVFIDDDEQPLEGWLSNLLDTQRATGAQAVSGPVFSEYDGVLDPWIVAGRFFKHPRYATGTVIPVAATNNLLLLRSFVAEHNLRFDRRFGLSGGEDSVFTRQLTAAGGTIVWCDEARVRDVIPAERATREWVRQRALRLGNSEARAKMHVAAPGLPALGARMNVLARGLLRVVGGGGKAVAGRVIGSLELNARGTRALLRGWGMIQALVGHQRLEYQRDGD